MTDKEAEDTIKASLAEILGIHPSTITVTILIFELYALKFYDNWLLF